MSYFFTINAEIKILLTIKLIFRFKILLIIIVALINFFKTSTIYSYFLYLILFLTFGLKSSIIQSELGFKKVISNDKSGKFFLGFYLANLPFFGIVYCYIIKVILIYFKQINV